MIDHVSIGVRDLAAAAAFYEQVLSTIGLQKLVVRETTVGFGKSYPEFWLNARPGMAPVAGDGGSHLCLRARSQTQVDDFYKVALALGAKGDGAPGIRSEYSERYYAAFVRDADGNRIEVVTFISTAEARARESASL
jgi:catechol 2,3-dioxygenase-like lactoylglutathione lyase family enzyme